MGMPCTGTGRRGSALTAGDHNQMTVFASWLPAPSLQATTVLRARFIAWPPFADWCYGATGP